MNDALLTPDELRGPGWRLIECGEVFKKGDVFWTGSIIPPEWCVLEGQLCNGTGCFYRRVVIAEPEPPATLKGTDLTAAALRDMAKDMPSWLNEVLDERIKFKAALQRIEQKETIEQARAIAQEALK